MFGAEINQVYLIIAFMILFVAYCCITGERDHIATDVRKILIKTERGLVNYTPSGAYVKLNQIKSILIGKLTTGGMNGTQTQRLIRAANDDLLVYININSSNIIDVEDPDTYSHIYNHYINMLEQQTYTSTFDISQLIINLEYLGSLIQQGVNFEGVLDIRNIYIMLRALNASDSDSMYRSINFENMTSAGAYDTADRLRFDAANERDIGEIEAFGMVPNSSNYRPHIRNLDRVSLQQTNIDLTQNCEDANEFCNESEAPLRYFASEKSNLRSQVRSVYNDSDAGTNLSGVRRVAKDTGPWYDINKMKAERAAILDMTTEVNSTRSLRDDYANIETNIETGLENGDRRVTNTFGLVDVL